MENMEIVFPRLFFTGNRLLGERVENVSRTLGDLRGIFADVDKLFLVCRRIYWLMR